MTNLAFFCALITSSAASRHCVLVLRNVRAVHDVGNKLRAERQRHVVAVDVTRLVVVDEEQIVPLVVDGDVGVFADLDVSIGAQNEEPAIAPCSQAVGRKPVEPHIAESAVAAQHHVAEILKSRTVRMAHIGDLRLRHFGLLRSRVEEKLVHLVRADVAQNSAVLVGIPEPLGPPRSAAGVSAC